MLSGTLCGKIITIRLCSVVEFKLPNEPVTTPRLDVTTRKNRSLLFIIRERVVLDLAKTPKRTKIKIVNERRRIVDLGVFDLIMDLVKAKDLWTQISDDLCWINDVYVRESVCGNRRAVTESSAVWRSFSKDKPFLKS